MIRRVIRRDRARSGGLPIGRWSFLVIHMTLGIAVLVVAFPLLWTVISALKTPSEFYAAPWALPGRPSFDNFVTAWARADMGRLLINSGVVSAASTILTIVAGILAAFAFARSRSRAARLLYLVLLAGLFIPLDLIMLPLFIELRALGLISNYLGLILPYSAVSLPLAVLILTQAVRTVPRDLIDSATMDGAGPVAALRHVVIPLASPGILAAGTLTFVTSWNEFLLALVIMRDPDMRTIPVGLTAFTNPQLRENHLILAAIVISAIPTLLVFAIFQRQFMRGITAGALK